MRAAGEEASQEKADFERPRRTHAGAVILGRPATLADLDDLPRTWRGEILDGTLYAFPRPRGNHQQAIGSIQGDLRGPFARGKGGPGGWWILSEPGIQLPRAREISPDVAGWRRERLPHIPHDAPITVAPDWVCEILSPSTRSYDQVVKRRFYAGVGVPYLWYVEPLARLLMAARLVQGQWVELGAWRDDERPRVEPFEAIELDLASWWEGVALETPEDEGATSPEPPSSDV